MPAFRTPDVYVSEIPVFPPSVAEVATAVPAFVGYTEKAKGTDGSDLALKPTRISSMREYEERFGFAEKVTTSLKIEEADGGGYRTASFTEPTLTYLLYWAVRMYFNNGGGPCYVVSVGNYNAAVTKDKLMEGLDAVAREDEPTLIVIPEAVKLTTDGHYDDVVKAVLAQCGTLQDRFGIFDVLGGDADESLEGAQLTAARSKFGANDLKYGAAYYPFLKTSFNHYLSEEDADQKVTVTIGSRAGVALGLLKTSDEPPPPPTVAAPSTATTSAPSVTRDLAAYNFVKTELAKHFITMPPSGAVAGVYATVDRTRGVWKAPANVSLAGVIEPVVRLDSEEQGRLNVDDTGGKSINAIRAFAGKGTLVWGARTLAGNDNEWRYVNVRRFFNMVEESVKKSTYWAVFESNDANTWVKVRGMIENYLIDRWRDGALAGATPKDAFFVRCGLGTTMSSQDILEGRMNVEIGMAVVRPAEFIVLKFFHKMQTS